jgi:hypothetical protein
MKWLVPDRRQLKGFAGALFKHATPGTWVSLRSLPDKGSEKHRPFKITPVKLNGNFDALIDKAFRDAERAANAGRIVFAPPVATFSNSRHAREVDLAEGLVLNVEWDQHAQEGRAKLEKLLGRATVVVASGGEWTDQETGELKPKLHVHFRLKVPARGKRALAKLKLARMLATAIVGGDASNITAVHPIRWPGSWHCKGKPSLCRIVSLRPKAELDLNKALAILKKAAPAVTCARHTANLKAQADPDLMYAAMVVIPNNDVSRDEWNKKGMAIFRATAGDPRGLEAFEMWSKKSAKSHGGYIARWQHFFSSPPSRIGAGSIIYWANNTDPTWRQRHERERWLRFTKIYQQRLNNKCR